MQRGKRRRRGARKVARPAVKAAAPAQHPGGVLNIAEVAEGIDVHKMRQTVKLLSEDAGGEVPTETREYRNYGRELEEFSAWLAGQQPGRGKMDSMGCTGVVSLLISARLPRIRLARNWTRYQDKAETIHTHSGRNEARCQCD